MKKSKVFYVKVKKGDPPELINKNFSHLILSSGILKNTDKGCYSALKLTFGEKGNRGHVNPLYIRTLADMIKDKGAKPFFIETSILYKGERMNAPDHIKIANEHGFGYEATGCPVIIGDGLAGEIYTEVEINKKHVKKAKIAGIAVSADCIFGISHITGHMMTGFSGNIKNMGMGLASRAGKLIQHSNISPKVTDAKCTSCGKCMQVCPVNAITWKDKKAFINDKICIGCSDCLVACRFDAISISWQESAKNLQEKMAEYAYAALKGKEGRSAFINFATKITRECDCLAKDDPAITEDIGIFISSDIVACDKATIDTIISESKSDPFKAAWPRLDWKHQFDHAQAIGLGNTAYELIEASV